MGFEHLRMALSDRWPARRQAPADRKVLDALADWLARAQDATGSGGVSSHYDLQKKDWAAAYPETTGYIIPTLLNYAKLSGRTEFKERAMSAADWEVDIQLPEGGVRAGTLDADVITPTIFNTGQVLFGWVRAYQEFKDPRYRNALERAANWLLSAQDADGAWRRFPSPFTAHSLNAYNTRTAYGLVVASEVIHKDTYTVAASRNIEWALSLTHANGWLPDNCLSDNARPLTHTIAYAIRGILEVSAALGNSDGLNVATRMAEGVATSLRQDGALPGRLDKLWRPSARWSCMTGNAQMAIIWLRLGSLTGNQGLLEYANRAIDFLLRSVVLEHRLSGVRGGVKGSSPLDGAYMRYRYPSWATKFFADALLLREGLGGVC